jgi:ATP adenylyltransferase
MEVLWAPWRMDYILAPKPDACVLCPPAQTDRDADRLILHRGRHAFVIMNKFPYAHGHLMVAPLRHEAELARLTPAECSEMFWLVQKCTDILRQFCHPQGFNIGLNIGEAAGAGVREHLHIHIVPRWNGDASFITTVGEARVIPEHIATAYSRLVPYFAALPGNECPGTQAQRAVT